MSLTDDKYRSSKSRHMATPDPEPLECQMADVQPQSSAPISRARGFEEIGMGTVDADTAVHTDTKK